jgi:hypothetical protein
MLKRGILLGTTHEEEEECDHEKADTLCGDHFPVACHLPFIPENLVHQGHEQCFPTPLVALPWFRSTSKAAFPNGMPSLCLQCL